MVLRAKSLGGSDIAALYGLSPYATPYMLWHEKNGDLPSDIRPENNRMIWGKRLEDAIAKGISEDMRWTLEERQVYCESEEIPGMGCTLDRRIIDPERGPGCLEIKNVDWFQYKEGWTDTIAPTHIEIQLQHQLAVTGDAWGAIACFVGGNDLKIYERDRDEDAIAALKRDTETFWGTIADGVAPDPFGKSIEMPALRIMSQIDPKLPMLDLTGDKEAFDLCVAMERGRIIKKAGTDLVDGANVMLLHKIGQHKDITIPGFKFSRRKDGPIYACEMLKDAAIPKASEEEVVI